MEYLFNNNVINKTELTSEKKIYIAEQINEFPSVKVFSLSFKI